jgi:hypothetical protein
LVAASPSRTPGDRDTVHFQLSPLLLIGLVSAVISTVAVVIAAVSALQPGQGPPPGAVGRPPPPTEVAPLVLAIGFFVISWVTVAVAVARDQIAQRLSALHDIRSSSLEELRADIDEIRTQTTAMAKVEARVVKLVEDYGELRETDGYLDAMRAAAGTNGEVRSLRTVPPRDR